MMKKEAVQHERLVSVLAGGNNMNQTEQEQIKSKAATSASFGDQTASGRNMCTYGFDGMSGAGEMQGEGQRAGGEPVMLANTQPSHHHPTHNIQHGTTSMSGYSYVLSDPMIQESLSPFFQPYGIDVSRFPMTSPPIFQSSLASCNAPARSRRISISNGQIGQMGQMTDNEDIIENIHDVQPPPMPQRRMLQGKSQMHAMPSSSFPPEYAGHRNTSSQDSHLSAGTAVDIPQREHHPQGLPEASHESAVGSVELHSADFSALPVNVGNGPPSKSDSFQARSDAEAMPGTAAWKRARLLERNRIAASKCRQRKKIAQQQLQKGVDLLARENKVMKRKLEYYQKLVSKFKIFVELHMNSCGGNKDSLKVVEELLKIDHGLNENEDGLLEVKDLQDDPKLIDIN